MEPKTDLAKHAIKRAFTGFESFSEKDTHDISLHLTDWVDDLQRLVGFLENPTNYSDDEIQSIVIAFLAHVPYHMKEAANMLFADGERTTRKRNRSR